MKKSIFRNFILVGVVTAIFILISSFFYYLIGHEYNWAFFECLYFVVVTVTTVGYGEIIDFSKYGSAGVTAR